MIFGSATVVGLVAMFMVSTNALAVPVVLPIAIERAAAGLTLPRLMLVIRVLLPRLRAAVPADPAPESILTTVAAVVAPFSIFRVSPLVEFPSDIEFPELLALPILIDPALVVPRLIEPEVADWIETLVPPSNEVVVVDPVLPSVKLAVFAEPILTAPFVLPPPAEPESIVTAPELPVEASPDLRLTAPVEEVAPVVLPERSANAAEGEDAAVVSPDVTIGVETLVPKKPFANVSVAEPTFMELFTPGSNDVFMATAAKLDRAVLAPVAL